MPAAIALALSGLLLIVPEIAPLPLDPVSPCPAIFRYEQVPQEEAWRANLTLISDSDLDGVWVRLLTKPKLRDLVVSDNFVVKYNGTEEIRLSNRHYNLKAAIPASITVSGKLQDGAVPELISVILNGKLICSSKQINGSSLYIGDFSNKNYLSSIKPQNFTSQNRNGSKCGRALLLNALIPNDNIKVLPGEWPWQAGLFKEVNSTQTLLCEATLISENTLLTSAHCVTWQDSNIPVSASLLTARLKNLNVQEANEDDIYKVKTVIVHPDFNEKALTNDVAVVKLEKNVEADDAVQPICLPSSGKLPEESFVLGYGFKGDGSLLNLGVAKTVPLVDDTCAKLEPSYVALMNDDNYCATFVQDHEVCIGSSGSGVMDVKSDSEYVWELRGVLSVGRALHEKFKCDQNSPILIADVSKYLKWIKSNIS